MPVIVVYFTAPMRTNCSRRSRDFEFGARLSIFYFFVLSRPEVKTSPNLFCPIPLPFTCSRWRFSRPFPRALFYCVYVTLPLIRGPRNFASFSPVWPPQPYWMVSLVVVVYFNFVRLFALPRAEFDCVFSASFIRSHRFVLFVIYCIFAVNTIQCSDCCRVGRQNLCLSFLSNILWCIDRESLPIVLAVTSSSSPAW